MKLSERTSRSAQGRYFPSKGEAGRGEDLSEQMRKREIRNLIFNPSVEIIPGLIWKLDFSYAVKGFRQTIFEDYKGVFSEGVRIKAKIWGYVGPGVLRFIGWSGREFYTIQEIVPKGIAQLRLDLRRLSHS